MALGNDSAASAGIAGTLPRVGKYVLARAAILFLTVVVTVYVTILVANLGGYVDKVVKAQIDFALGDSRTMKGLTPEEQAELFEQRSQAAYEAAGLNQPFVVRCFRWLGRGLTLQWGETNVDSVAWSSHRKPIRVVILENLPRTLLIFGTANLFLFFTTVFLALPLSRNYGGWPDRLVTALSPLSAAPAWVYGILLNIVFLRIFGGLFAGGTFDAWPDEFKLAHIPFLVRHMVLPAAAIFLSGLFQGIYAWRTLFSLHAQEDHVEMAKAKGLPPRVLERRYILRPLLPSLITSLSLLFASLWQEAIILEHFFNVAGIGRLFVRAIERFDTPVIVALVVTFAYLVAITVFLLDVLYAVIDPRVRVGGRRRATRAASRKRKRGLSVWSPWKRLRRGGSSDPPVSQERGRERSGDRRGSQRLSGLEALDRILGEFPSAESVEADWLAEPGTGHVGIVDRLYPELGIAVSFVATDSPADGVSGTVRRRAGIVLVEMDPNRPVSIEALREMRVALSAAARRVAHRRGSHRAKLTLMPRIAAAKSACQRMLETLEAEIDPPQQVSRWRAWRQRLVRLESNVASGLEQLFRYPSAALGLFIIAALLVVSICTVIVLPYDEMIALWREGDEIWARNPRAAAPAWFNLFRREDLPRTIRMRSHGGDGAVGKSSTAASENMTEIVISFPFDFQYDGFPQDLLVTIDATYGEKKPLAIMTWLTPDGREIELASDQIEESYAYRLSSDDRVQRKANGKRPMEVLFADPAVQTSVPLKGGYELQVKTFVFEENADVESEFVLFGEVYGLAGTDSSRRDLLIPLLWGMPIALAFGILAAVGTSVSSMVIAGVGTWFGGWVDVLVQRITEVNMVLPFLPVSIMVYTLYSKNLWAILGVTVLLSVFGSAIKNYRAIFLQVKEAPYVEAAQAYGTSDWRIIFRYLIPRIVPVLIPQLVILVPSYVFLEATLAFLGISDPVLPTWGKLIVEGLSRGIHTGDLHLFLEPLGLLALVAFAFVLLGAALERIFQPRLREI
jgi:peptide/nickel transport system permease protein